MITRLATIDPKLLSFSLLLAGVSLYLLVKAKSSPLLTNSARLSELYADFPTSEDFWVRTSKEAFFPALLGEDFALTRR
jgi:hypothetical protein